MKYKHKVLDIQEIWFDNTQALEDVDKVIYQQVPNKLDNSFDEFYTLIINLEEDEEEIFKKFKKNLKYEINRAIKKDEVVCDVYFKDIDDTIIEKFVNSYNSFANQRSLGEISLDIFKNYAKNDNLMIATVSNKEGDVFSWHTHIVIDDRVRLKTSNSFFDTQDNETRNLIGRANKCLHWEVMKFIKNSGFKTYDFGGWYHGQEDQKKLSINKFKEAFGGEKEMSYNGQVCLTLKCKLYTVLAKLKKALKG